jgi:VIT1/CCC1 family predicted Fe2+/Mn2+ transporter
MNLSKRLEEARQAFLKKKNVKASLRIQDPNQIALAMEKHGSLSSQFIGNMVYGGLDGIISIFAVVSGVAGAQLSAGVLLILGAANLLGDGFSMGVGAFLSMKSEKEYYDQEYQRESAEVENNPEVEKKELEDIYLKQGYPQDDAKKMIEIKTKDKSLWLKAMMIEELGLTKDERKPTSAALITFGSFVGFGLLPLLIYVIDLVFKTHFSPATLFIIAIFLSALSLFSLGAAKVFITQRSPVRSGLEMLIVGGLAAGVAYFVGVLLKPLGG